VAHKRLPPQQLPLQVPVKLLQLELQQLLCQVPHLQHHRKDNLEDQAQFLNCLRSKNKKIQPQPLLVLLSLLVLHPPIPLQPLLLLVRPLLQQLNPRILYFIHLIH
jgi:hypothetical protein